MSNPLRDYLIRFDDDDIFMKQVTACIEEIRNSDLKPLYRSTVIGRIADTFYISDMDAELVYMEWCDDRH